MKKNTCEACGCEVEVGAIEKHHIVPPQVTEQANMPESRTVELCGDCHSEVHIWNSTNVADMSYDTKIKRFRTKPPLKMVKEYEFAYRVFTQHKKEKA